MSDEKVVLKNTIRVLDQEGNEKASASSEGAVILAWIGQYEEGDKIVWEAAETDKYYVIRLDDTMYEDLVYLTKSQVEFVIPFEEKKTSYNPKAFTGERHYLTMRPALEREIYAYRNLAKNSMDQHGVFAARNAIDGVLANESHGYWPYESWGINQQDDAELTLEFGRPVDFDEIVLYTRADFPHDNWWEQVTFTFSDGSEETVSLEKSVKPHIIPMKKSGITWLKFGKLIKADDPSPFPALTQIEVYGTYCK